MPNDGESVESWEARRQRNLAKGINGNGQGTPLGIAVKLLPTPRTSDTNGAGQHGDGGMDLRTTVSLLPTPAAASPSTANFRPDGTPYSEGYGMTLLDAARLLLPTPTASDGDRASTEYGRGNPTLRGAVSSPPSAAGSTQPGDPHPGQLMIGDA
jgi:hypothetical protein